MHRIVRIGDFNIFGSLFNSIKQGLHFAVEQRDLVLHLMNGFIGVVPEFPHDLRRYLFVSLDFNGSLNFLDLEVLQEFGLRMLSRDFFLRLRNDH